MEFLGSSLFLWILWSDNIHEINLPTILHKCNAYKYKTALMIFFPIFWNHTFQSILLKILQNQSKQGYTPTAASHCLEYKLLFSENPPIFLFPGFYPACSSGVAPVNWTRVTDWSSHNCRLPFPAPPAILQFTVLWTTATDRRRELPGSFHLCGRSNLTFVVLAKPDP